MRRLTALVGAAAVLATVTAGLSGPTASAAPPDRSAAEHRRIVDYWTQARRDSAIPRDIQRPNARPPGGGGGGGGGTVTGSTWTQAADVVSIVGKVFFTMDGVRYVCSGSVVDSPIGNVVLTAGHCVKDGQGEWATNWIFYPAYNNGPSSLGAWTATDLFTTSVWNTYPSSNAFDDDAGFAVVTGSGNLEEVVRNTNLGAGLVNIPTIDFSGPGTSYHSFGYPAAGKYKGQKLTYCAGPATIGLDGHDTQSIACNMTGGSSGGPWYETFGENAPYVVSSLNSYGYQTLNGYMFGPIFGVGEQAAFNGAATGDCPPNPSAYVCAPVPVP